MIEVNSISFRYHEDWVLQNISFRVEKGEFVGVIGPNGSGKTTLLKCTVFLRLRKGKCLRTCSPKEDRPDEYCEEGRGRGPRN